MGEKLAFWEEGVREWLVSLCSVTSSGLVVEQDNGTPRD